MIPTYRNRNVAPSSRNSKRKALPENVSSQAESSKKPKLSSANQKKKMGAKKSENKRDVQSLGRDRRANKRNRKKASRNLIQRPRRVTRSSCRKAMSLPMLGDVDSKSVIANRVVPVTGADQQTNGYVEQEFNSISHKMTTENLGDAVVRSNTSECTKGSQIGFHDSSVCNASAQHSSQKLDTRFNHIPNMNAHGAPTTAESKSFSTATKVAGDFQPPMISGYSTLKSRNAFSQVSHLIPYPSSTLQGEEPSIKNVVQTDFTRRYKERALAATSQSSTRAVIQFRIGGDPDCHRMSQTGMLSPVRAKRFQPIESDLERELREFDAELFAKVSSDDLEETSRIITPPSVADDGQLQPAKCGDVLFFASRSDASSDGCFDEVSSLTSAVWMSGKVIEPNTSIPLSLFDAPGCTDWDFADCLIHSPHSAADHLNHEAPLPNMEEPTLVQPLVGLEIDLKLAFDESMEESSCPPFPFCGESYAQV